MHKLNARAVLLFRVPYVVSSFVFEDFRLIYFLALADIYRWRRHGSVGIILWISYGFIYPSMV